MKEGFNINDFGAANKLRDSGANLNSKPRRQECEAEDSNHTKNTSIYDEVCFSQIAYDKYICSHATQEKIPPGVYTIASHQKYGFVFENKNIESDMYISFEQSPLEKILADIDLFWTKEQVYNHYGFTFRRGLLLYGIAGGGKSTLVYQAIHRFIARYNGLVFLATDHPNLIGMALKKIRSIDPHCKYLIIFEDVDAYVNSFGEEALLNLLDGEFTINNSFVIATTNYPEKLDRRLVARPRRFDRVIKINAPDDSMRSQYFKEKLKMDGDELQKYVKATEGFTFAALTELVISVKCLDYPFDDSIATIKQILAGKSTSSEYLSDKAGFQ